MWMIGLTTHLLQLFLLLRVKTYQLLWSDLSAMAHSPNAYLSYPSLYHQWPKMPCGGEDHWKQYPGAVAHQCHLCSKGLPSLSAKKPRCAHCFHPRSHIYYATEILYLTLCQDIMVALLDDKLLDYRTIFPFLFIDVELYVLLEENYFNGRLPPNHY